MADTRASIARALRERTQGQDVGELAQRAGLTVDELTRGTRDGDLDLDGACRLAAALGIDVDELVTGMRPGRTR